MLVEIVFINQVVMAVAAVAAVLEVLELVLIQDRAIEQMVVEVYFRHCQVLTLHMLAAVAVVQFLAARVWVVAVVVYTTHLG
jgi:hypothetical protein